MWRFVRWPLLVAFALYAALVIYRIPAVGEKQRTAEAVAHIHMQKITLDDVMGKNLPPMPDSSKVDTTVAGVDANRNGIRDDVELAIFKKYPNSAKVRAAELQYASVTQIMLTEVFNAETWIAAAQEDSRGSACIGLTTEDLKVYLSRVKEVTSLVVNSPIRANEEDKAYSFTTSYGDLQNSPCDVDLDTL
jgi:hypothetical protein